MSTDKAAVPVRLIGRYELLEKIGAGGMGEVYRARDLRLERDVAVKLLPSGMVADEAARRRFRNEALSLSRISHSNIAAVFDFDTDGSTDFLVMEYVPGATLTRTLGDGPLSVNDVVELGMQLCNGLAAAHTQGVIHRDLKPDNLKISTDGRLRILDFGLAKLMDRGSTDTATGSGTESTPFAGTPSYMAPEQIRGESVDARTDIWAAGCVLYQMATGEAPFKASGLAVASQILDAAPAAPSSINPQVSTQLERTILQCLKKNPADRYASARDLELALRRVAQGRPALAASTQHRRRWIAMATIVALALTAIALSAAFYVKWMRGTSGTPPPITSIAVLPLANLSGDPSQEYFADGMTEAIITNLSRITSLRVISRTSVMRFKDARAPLPQIARELGVEAVVEGSVLRAGNRVRITAQLIRVAPEQHLWADTYDREIRDVLALHREIAQAIAGEVQAKLLPPDNARVAVRPVNPEAYEAYLKGRHYWNERSESSLRKALQYFQQAIHIDPDYAAAYAGVADTYYILGQNLYAPPEEVWPQAKAAATRALQLEENLAEGHAALAKVLVTYEWDIKGAEREFRRAIELNRADANSHAALALLLSFSGRHSEAISEVKLARHLDPVLPRVAANVGVAFYYARQYDSAMDELGKALELFPDHATTHEYLGMALAQKGQHSRALEECSRAQELENSPKFALGLAYAYAVAGERERATAGLRSVLRQSSREYVSATLVAEVYTGLGDNDRAVEWLERAYRAHDPRLIVIGANPIFDPLRSDQRFNDLLRRVNLD